jgi:nitrate/TMAO reductase-like tetraheme cytochrome c subunit
MSRIKEWLRPVVYLGTNPLSLIGAILTTSAAIMMVVAWTYDILNAGRTRPYEGIVIFFILPAIFVFGLILMPAGGLLRRYRLKQQGKLPHVYPTIDLKQPVLQKAIAWVVVMTFLNVALMGTASYKAIEHMDTVEFCGKTCHSVMAPEYTAYMDSPHSRVACAECHIGSGAPWFVRAKISGVRQLFAVNLKTYSRPIPSPVHNLRPSRDTCEHCHWPERFTGDKLVVRTKYADDEQNTPSTTVLLLKIGGRATQGLVGIHGRHLSAEERIEYVSTDGRRQVIPQVFYTEDDGKKSEYKSDETKATAADLAKGERRKMDCVDCHNRPTHAFELPERAVDNAITAGRIDRSLPFIKKEAVAVLRTEYPDRGAASEKIPQAIADFYKAKYPDVYQGKRPVVETAAQRVKEIYLRNVFPEMKLTWGSHPNNIGHDDFLGCFRCHDGKHKTEAGKVISDDCSACHQVLAMDEKDPKILADLGLK